MLYYLFRFLEDTYNLPGASLFSFISFRGALALCTSLFIAALYGKKIIRFLQRKQIYLLSFSYSYILK